MQPLSKKQLELLKELNETKSIRYSKIPTEDIEDYEFLQQKGLVYIKSITSIDKSIPWPHFCEQRTKVIILPAGEAVVDSTRKETFRFYLPFSVSTLLSLIAIGISILALIVSIVAIRC